MAQEFDALLAAHGLPSRSAARHMANGCLQGDAITGIDRVQYPDLLPANQFHLMLKIAQPAQFGTACLHCWSPVNEIPASAL